MTQLPFEDLPEKPAKGVTFADFWTPYPRKVGKRRAVAAFVQALRRTSADKILAGLARYKRNKPAYCDWMHPTTFLNGDHWEDEYDAPKMRGSDPYRIYDRTQLQIIANHVKADWYERGQYSHEVLQQCVDAGLLTQEEMEKVL